MKKFPYKLVISIGIGIAVILGIYNLYILVNPKIRTQIATTGTIEEYISADGFVIRDEQILVQDTGLVVDSLVADGERVAKDSQVAVLYHSSIGPAVQANLKSINERILSLERLKEQNEDVASADAGRIESLTKAKVLELMRYSHFGQGISLSDVKSQLEEVVNQKIATDAESTSNVLGELKAQKQQLEAGIAGEKTPVYSNVAGLYFSYFDGYEGYLSTDAIESLTPSTLEQLETMEDKHIGNGSVAKVVDSFEWNVAAAVDTKKISSIEEGDSIQLRFPEYGNEIYSATVEYISADENGKSVICCSADTYTDTVYYNRKLKVDIIKNISTGLKFSKDAIQVIDGTTGVFIVKDSVAKFRPVDVLSMDEGYVVVKEDNGKSDNVLLYDEVIIKGNNIKSGDVVR